MQAFHNRWHLFFSPWKMLSINTMISTPEKVVTTRAKPPGGGGLTDWLTDRYSFYICDSHPDRTHGLTARDYIHNWNYLPKMYHPVCDAAIPVDLLKGWRMHLHLMVRGPLALTSAARWGKKKISVSAVKDFSNNITSTKVSRVLKKACKYLCLTLVFYLLYDSVGVEPSNSDWNACHKAN